MSKWPVLCNGSFWYNRSNQLTWLHYMTWWRQITRLHQITWLRHMSNHITWPRHMSDHAIMLNSHITWLRHMSNHVTTSYHVITCYAADPWSRRLAECPLYHCRHCRRNGRPVFAPFSVRSAAGWRPAPSCEPAGGKNGERSEEWREIILG